MEKKNNTIQVSDAALSAINGLQHPAGTYDYYRRTLDRLFNTVLHASEELGMDDMEAVATLRAIDSIRQDLATIAGPVARHKCREQPTEEEIAERVEETFTDIDDSHDSNYPQPEESGEVVKEQISR